MRTLSKVVVLALATTFGGLARAETAVAPPDPSYAEDMRLQVAPFDAVQFAETFTHGKANVDGVTLHYVEGGEGSPIILLHGWPETWYSWRRVMPFLAEGHRVIAIDMPGFGDSSPAPSADKRTVAELINKLAVELGVENATVVGHDMGGGPAFALAYTHPEMVGRLVLVDTAPAGFGGFADGSPNDILNLSPQTVDGTWHFAFFLKHGMAEMLVPGHERAFISAMVKDSFTNPNAFSEDELDELVRWISLPGGLTGGLDYYRAIFEDAEQNQAWVAAGKLQMPVHAISAGDGFLQYVLPGIVETVAVTSSSAVAPHTGHFIADERPLWLATEIASFADGAATP